MEKLFHNLRKLEEIVSERKYDLEEAAKEIKKLFVYIDVIFDDHLKVITPPLRREWELIQTYEIENSKHRRLSIEIVIISNLIGILRAENDQRFYEGKPELNGEEILKLEEQQKELQTQQSKLRPVPGLNQLSQHVSDLMDMINSSYGKSSAMLASFKRNYTFYRIIWFFFQALLFLLAFYIPMHLTAGLKKFLNLNQIDLIPQWEWALELCVAIFFLFTGERLIDCLRKKHFWWVAEKVMKKYRETHRALNEITTLFAMLAF